MQNLFVMPKGMLVHNCSLNSFGLPVSHAISRRGTLAFRMTLVTNVRLSKSREYKKDWVITWAKQWNTLNRKKARDILLSVMR